MFGLCKTKKIKDAEDPITAKLKKNGSIVLLDGSWGVGKTFRFQKIINKQLTDSGFDVRYISLFGLKNTEQIRNEIYKSYIQKKGYFLILTFSSILLALLLLFLNSEIFNSVFFQSIKTQYTTQATSIMFGIELVFLTLIIHNIPAIARHLLTTYLGINHNTVSITDLYNKKKTIFCFDDIERISEDASIDEFLGFICTLAKTDGFSVLVISCYNKCLEQEERKRLMTLYKEKIFDYQVKDEISDAKIKSIFDEYPSIASNTDLLLYIQDIYKDLREKEIAIGTNLRTLQKLCRNLVTINDAINGFEKLTQNCVDDINVWAYIAYLTFAQDKNEEIDCGLQINFLNQEQTEREIVENILLKKQNNITPIKYKSVYNAIIYGRVNFEELRKELLPFDYGNYTEFEKKYLPMQKRKEPFYMEPEERKSIIRQIEKDFMPDTQLFSTVLNMQDIMFFYLKLYQPTETRLDKEQYDNIKNIIKNNISSFTNEELKNAMSNNTYAIPLTDNICIQQQKEIMDFLIECCIRELMEKFKDCWLDELNSAYSAIAVLSISFYPETLFEIYRTNFRLFKDVTYKIWFTHQTTLAWLNQYKIKPWYNMYIGLQNKIIKQFQEKLVQLPEEEKYERQEIEKHIREFEIINKQTVSQAFQIK